jgi:hypothetical protein
MDATRVFRLISLIPDRALRVQSGAAFVAEGKPERVLLLAKFLHWLGPLDPLSKEDQQALGVRSGGGKSMAEEGDEADPDALEDIAVEEIAADTQAPTPQQGAGTQIAGVTATFD